MTTTTTILKFEVSTNNNNLNTEPIQLANKQAEMAEIDTSDLPAAVGERHVLNPQEELRFEVPFFAATQNCSFTLQKGSCELWGCEMGVKKKYSISNGGINLALFTWHGCVIDVDCPDMELSYCSAETDPNVSFVNTHAQLEALRDEAAATSSTETSVLQGPRVMVVGPPESGKSSLVKTLIAYACKVGRTPLWVDLDPLDNSISVPGTLAVAPMTAAAITIETYATTGIPPSTPTTPIVLWHGSSSELNPDLFRAQVEALAEKVDKRLEGDDLARSSGIIVNTNGWIQDDGYKLLLDAIKSLNISVVLIMGHDRLYSMMTNHIKKNKPDFVDNLKVLKLPRSGGVVSRQTNFVRNCRSRAVKRYFYGDLIESQKAASSASGSSDAPSSSTSAAANKSSKVPQLTPFLLQIPFSSVKIYKLSSISLSSSLLPVAQQQTTDAIQLNEVELSESLQHAVLAVCHPTSVQAYTQSGRARDLVTAGVAGFCAVERVVIDTDMLHLLSPCTGSLPSDTLLLGDVSWME